MLIGRKNLSRIFLAAGCLWLFLAAQRPANAEDWPTYGHDNARSCATPERIETGSLQVVWTYRSPHRPRPCWPEPMEYDWYHRGPYVFIKPRIIFDKVFHVAVVGDSVYFGSSADDRIHCLDAATGRPRWSFCTEGPVRLAPSFWNDKIYAGSDDGYVYCLRAADGQLVWKQKAAPGGDYRVPNDGKLISLWPIRAGLAVEGSVVYCCAGLFPSETVYLCAFSAESGLLIWRTPSTSLSPQGYILVSPTRLYVPQGRSRPAVFNRLNGQYLGRFGGGGGTYALLTDDNVFIYGPGRYTGTLDAFDAETRDELAVFEGGNHIIVYGNVSYLQTDTELAALDRAHYLELAAKQERLMARQARIAARLKKASREGKAEEVKNLQDDLKSVKLALAAVKAQFPDCIIWRRSCPYPYALILAGDTLFAGGDGEIGAFDASDGTLLWTGRVEGKVYGLAAANGRLFASTDTGAIFCFAATSEVRSPRGAGWKAYR